MKKLLFLSSYAYPEFDSTFKRYNFDIKKVTSLRKAVAAIRQFNPDVIVAEFVYAPTYGSQLSNYESLFAAAQTFSPDANFIALTHKEDLPHFEKVSKQNSNCQVLTLPAKPSDLDACISEITKEK